MALGTRRRIQHACLVIERAIGARREGEAAWAPAARGARVADAGDALRAIRIQVEGGAIGARETSRRAAAGVGAERVVGAGGAGQVCKELHAGAAWIALHSKTGKE